MAVLVEGHTRTTSVVDDHDLDPVRFVHDGHADVTDLAGVFAHVRQRLLDDAEQRQLEARCNVVGDITVLDEIHVQGRVPVDQFSELPERWLWAELAAFGDGGVAGSQHTEDPA